jgi:hypothetical protein
MSAVVTLQYCTPLHAIQKDQRPLVVSAVEQQRQPRMIGGDESVHEREIALAVR